jgi:hypothetical protein
MMSKIFLTGRSFGETCNYVCQDLERALILDVEGVRGHDLRLMVFDFVSQHGTRPEREKAVFHAMLSFPPGEDPGDEKMVRIAREWLRETGMSGTQHAIVKHTDKEHLHLHIVANRVNNQGITIGKGLVIERGIKAAQKLTREHGLIPERGKNLRLTHLDALHEPDAKRYRLYQAIERRLPGCRDIDELEKRLLEEGITVRYRLNPVDKKREGISFRIENQAFAGYKVDPGCSFKRLEKRILQLRLELELKLKEELDLKLKQEQDLRLRLRHSQIHHL